MLSRADGKRIESLKRRKTREAEGLFLAEGVRVAADLLAAGLRPRLAVISSSLEDNLRGREVAARLEGAAVRMERVTDGELSGLAATETPQGVLLVAEQPRWELAGLRVEGRATALVLDAVQDPGNFGTLVRTAEALGVNLVVALPGTVDPWNPKAVRAAAGSSFRVPVVQVELSAFDEWARELGFSFWGAEARGSAVESVSLGQRVALAVGNEGAGLSPEVERAVDGLLAVPLRGRAESLNVAVAAGILLYLVGRGV